MSAGHKHDCWDDVDPAQAEAEYYGEQDAMMGRLSEHLAAGKSISSGDLAKVLRGAMDVEIPKNVRQAIIDLLDPKIKTGRARRSTFFKDYMLLLRDHDIHSEYAKLRTDGVSSMEAIERLGKSNNLGYETIRTIVKSKPKL